MQPQAARPLEQIFPKFLDEILQHTHTRPTPTIIHSKTYSTITIKGIILTAGISIETTVARNTLGAGGVALGTVLVDTLGSNAAQQDLAGHQAAAQGLLLHSCLPKQSQSILQALNKLQDKVKGEKTHGLLYTTHSKHQYQY